MSLLPAKSPALLLVAIAAALSAGAAARTTDRNQPMDIESGRQVCGLGANDRCTLTGNVIITQGTLRVTSEQAVIEQSNGEPSRALMSGGVTLRQQLDDGNQINTTSANVDYNLRTEVVVFTGNVEIRQQRGSLTGERIVYNMRTGEVDSGGDGKGRVKMRILPRSAQAAPPQGRELMLVAQGLRKRYKSREVVRDFGLTLDAGEVVGLLGPNGAGKTTCFYMIVGLVPADTGSIVLDGHDITSEPMYARARRGVGYLPQEPSVFRKLSVADNIRLVLELRPDLDDDGRERELSALLDELQINHVADQLGASLSGGERRRVEIARALAGKPRLILLDEPFAGVDPISVTEIQRIVRHLKDRGIGVLITDHNVRETLGICDRAYILANGEVLAQGAPADLLDNPDVRRVYLGDAFRL